MNTFYFAPFQFILSSSSPLPLLGTTLRGGFGHIFKKIICLTKEKNCSRCFLVYTCPYSYIFQTPLPPDSLVFRKTKDIPRPFVFSLNNEKYSFDLILIGKGTQYLPYFLLVFDALGKKGIGKNRVKFSLEEVKDGEGRIVYSGKDKLLSPSFKIYTWEEFQKGHFSGKTILIRFLSPLRIKEKKKLIKEITFSLFIRSLVRRISLLSYFHCNFPLWSNLEPLLSFADRVKVKERNLTWKEISRYSTRQKERMKLGGVVGEIVFEGEVEPFLPLLRIGEFVHAGKGTTFGLGKYKICDIGES